MNEGRAVWYTLNTIEDKDGATSVEGGGVTSADDGDSPFGSLMAVFFTPGLRDAPRCELSVMAGAISVVADATAVGTCN